MAGDTDHRKVQLGELQPWRHHITLSYQWVKGLGALNWYMEWVLGQKLGQDKHRIEDRRRELDMKLELHQGLKLKLRRGMICDMSQRLRLALSHTDWDRSSHKEGVSVWDWVRGKGEAWDWVRSGGRDWNMHKIKVKERDLTSDGKKYRYYSRGCGQDWSQGMMCAGDWS